MKLIIDFIMVEKDSKRLYGCHGSWWDKTIDKDDTEKTKNKKPY